MATKGDRYSRVIRGLRGVEAVNAYINWIQNRSQTLENFNTAGQGRNRPATIKAVLRLFQFGIDDTEANNDYKNGVGVRVSLVEATFNTHQARLVRTGTTVANLIKPYNSGNVPSGWKIMPKGGATPATAIITTGRSTTGTRKTSHITKLKYTSYGGTSTSLPFGVPVSATGAVENPPDGATNAEEDVFEGIKTVIQASGNNILVTHKPETLASL